MAKSQTLKKVGGSIVAVLPKSMLGRFKLGAGDEVYVIETADGVLITPFDSDLADTIAVYERGAKRYRNAMRELGP